MNAEKKALVRQEIAGEALKHRAERAIESVAIAEQLRQHEVYPPVAALLGYVGIGWEPDTGPVLKNALADGKALYLPRVDNQTMTFHRVMNLGKLEKNSLGFLQPAQSEAAAVPDTALIMVPGIAFDRRGGRIGRGHGHYDRWLAEHNGIKVGLAFAWQILVHIPREPHDIGIDYLITPDDVIATPR